MINEENAKMFCCEDISKIYGYDEAVADKERVWDLHHTLGLAYSIDELREMKMYYRQPAELLMFVTRSDHKKLHFITNPITDEKRKRMSESQKGKKLPEETKRKISESLKGHPAWGLEKQTPESNAKRSAKLKGRKCSKEHCEKIAAVKRIPVEAFDDNGNVIYRFSSAKEAAEKISGLRSTISQCCNGKKMRHRGLHWRFAETSEK